MVNPLPYSLLVSYSRYGIVLIDGLFSSLGSYSKYDSDFIVHLVAIVKDTRWSIVIV